MLRLPIGNSIGAKIFGAFAVMSLVTAMLGGYSLYLISSAGKIIVDTYDRPLMAISYSRAASLIFAEMDKQVLVRRTAQPAEREAIDQSLDGLTKTFFEDIAVAYQRALADDERTVIEQIKDLVAQWLTLRQDTAAQGDAAHLDALSKQIAGRFDLLIEFTSGNSFVERRKAVWSIAQFQRTSIVVSVLVLLFSMGVTLLLARRIIRPLTAAAAVADRIAKGELQTPIPAGGDDETGKLLRSMTVMQDNIRTMIERETEQRRSAQNRLTDAIEGSHEGMVLVDAAGKIIHANNELATYFPGISKQLIEGQDFSYVFSAVYGQITRFMESGEERPACAPEELDGDVPLSSGGEFKLADGRWVRVSRSNTQDGGFFLFVSDFTKIKQREETFKEAKTQAEAISAAKSQFLANISHELRTPLNAIIGFSEIISSQLFGRIEEPRYIDYSNSILLSGRHLLDVINSILDVAKSEAGQLRLNAQRVDLCTVLNDCARIVAEQCLSAQLKFTLILPEHPIFLDGDAPKLRQIVINLLSNAIKFTEPGGMVTLSAMVLRGERVRIEVMDTGIGMRPEDVPVALSAFGQVDAGLSRRYEGTGLGLPLTKALVELMHGGTMNIDSAVGRGTTVSVILSCAARIVADASPPPVAAAS
jgi:PAS domain S-box-containing protein